ncbi:signal peptide peptidase SppA [Chryseolinea lacunae]|uniref:Signal peptide peptidase SppA n=1 Tax=Chryseolinea lacunae TaxID=2801331 RepID=A0ABS1KZT1_9BACT|nr:signal peptide peptidase SppA [Chryseolinea lacunae]MBL0744939.1 signal peptide peptidase SppA [Chryseolinea lacunae]
MSFFKSFMSSCLGALVAMILFVVCLVVFFSILSAGGSEPVELTENSVLKLDMDVPIIETEKEEPFSGIPFIGGRGNRPIGLAQLRQAIAHAKDDSKIKGIYLTVTQPMMGYTVIEEVRQALLDFRADGKWVVVYSEGMSESAYYLATAADKVYLNPQGEVEFNGLAVDITFFKRLFDKLEIKPEVFRVGEFKSAVEPFILEKMSDANRLQLTEMINSIYDQVLTRVSEARNIPKANLREISDKMLVRNAEQAQQYKLVDSLLYDDQVQDEIRHRLDLASEKKIGYVKFSRYEKTFSTYSESKNEVAVIVAEGAIYSGKASPGQEVIGSESFNEELRKARENDKVKAIVLRINSPGGSALASDAMWREISLTTKVKPVIASMSDYAASGGYYMAMGCDTIVAQPHTITGSIGVFSVLYDASGFLNNKIGITSEEVKTGEVGQLITVNRPLSELEKNIWQKRTEEVYDTFTAKAAEGRKMSVENIKKVASGRVWTGTQAKERGLVDVIGNFEDAVNIAAAAAGVKDDFKVKIYPQYKPSVFEQIVNQIEEDGETEALKEQLGAQYYIYQQWQHVRSYQGTQARMPFEMKIQ